MSNKNIKRIIATICLIVTLLSLAACGNDSGTSNTNADNTQSNTGHSSDMTFTNNNNNNITVGQSSLYGPEEEEKETPVLTNGTPIDVFSILEQFITYSRGNGGGKIEIMLPNDYYQEINGCYFLKNKYDDDGFDIIYNNETIGEFNFYLSKVSDGTKISDYYTGGDNFRVKISKSGIGSYKGGAYADYVNGDIYEHGFYMPIVEKVYTAPDFGEYITSHTQLSQAELEEIKTFAEKESFDDNYDLIDFKGYYAGTVKPYATTDPGSKFAIYLAYHYVMYEGYMYEIESYKAIAIDEIVRKPDGKLDFDLADSWSLSARGETAEELEDAILTEENYDFVKIA